LVNDIAVKFGVVGVQSVQEDMHNWSGDWDAMLLSSHYGWWHHEGMKNKFWNFLW